MPRVDSYSSLTPAWGKSCLLQLHLLHLVDLLLLVNGVPRGQLLVVGSRVEQLVNLASCVQLLVVGPRVGLVSRVEKLVVNIPRGQLLVIDVILDSSLILPNASPARLLDVWCFISSRHVVVVSFSLLWQPVLLAVVMLRSFMF